jgi:hypothetical protein
MESIEPTPDSPGPFIAIPDPPSLQELVASEDGTPPPTSPPLDNFATQAVRETGARRRQSSASPIATPDVNVQTALRKRIRVIQLMALPEHEKARHIQVGPVEAG